MEKILDFEPVVIPKNSFEQLRLSLAEYEGHQYVDVRVYFLNDDGEFVPTRKGVTVSPKKWGLFKAGIEELEQHMFEEGLLPGTSEAPSRG